MKERWLCFENCWNCWRALNLQPELCKFYWNMDGGRLIQKVQFRGTKEHFIKAQFIWKTSPWKFGKGTKKREWENIFSPPPRPPRYVLFKRRGRFLNEQKKGKVVVINIHSPCLPTTRPSICLDVRKYQYQYLDRKIWNIFWYYQIGCQWYIFFKVSLRLNTRTDYPLQV